MRHVLRCPPVRCEVLGTAVVVAERRQRLGLTDPNTTALEQTGDPASLLILRSYIGWSSGRIVR